ncbi:MAG: phage holin family protein [Gammaproteobacteria bacterium]|nr:phage holin family protein [Gammaproteobacteria bacterium]
MSFEGHDPRMTASEPSSPSSGLLDQDTSRLFHEFRELAHDHLELATLEARLSIHTLLRMAIIAIVTALVLASAWLALVGSAALALISLGVAPVLAMLILAAANLALGLAGWQRIRHISHWLGWPATQRAIKPSASNDARRGAA